MSDPIQLDDLQLVEDLVFHCAYCGEPNGTRVDPSAGSRQRYVEDCQVCCRPNVLSVRFDVDGGASIDTTPES